MEDVWRFVIMDSGQPSVVILLRAYLLPLFAKTFWEETQVS